MPVDEMDRIRIGSKKILNRPTFLLDGVFIIRGSSVSIERMEEDGYTVIYRDREGGLHRVRGIRSWELIG